MRLHLTQERQSKVPPKKKSGRSQAYPAVISVEKSNDAVATSSSPVEEEEEKGRGLNFLQRMKIRDKRQVEAGLLSSACRQEKSHPRGRERSHPRGRECSHLGVENGLTLGAENVLTLGAENDLTWG